MAQGGVGKGGLNAGAPRQATGRAIRCFVALQPDEAARERLDVLARAQQARFPAARRMQRDNIHLTLAFIGALDAAIAQRVAARLLAEKFEPFDWVLDAVGAFDRARVLWAGGTDARLEALAARVRQLLDALDVRYDRKPFVAHVTLLRKLPRVTARAASLAVEPPILWRAAAPVLLQSTTDRNGTRYTAVDGQDGSS